MNKANRNYSHLIHPITLILDLVILNTVFYFFFREVEYEFLLATFLSISWCFISWITHFYEVHRYSRVAKIVPNIVKQFVGLVIAVAALNGILDRFDEPSRLVYFTCLCMLIVSVLKLTIYFALKYFRRALGGNYRNVIFVGDTKELKALSDLFRKRKDMGYRILHYFNKEEAFQCITACVREKKIQEIFICFDYIVNSRYPDLFNFADNHAVKLKYVPDEKHLSTNSLKVHYYGYIPIISRREFPLDRLGNRLLKRLFDIVFSSVIIVFILSWLVPLIALAIRWETTGPIFFKQKRTGLHDKEFMCYKFRSMKSNTEADQQHTIKNDKRITKVGAFMRTTSIDELPQFFNVFRGDMSIVGPRPHMLAHTKEYSQRVNRFMLRHLIKPGITGMAQTHGYRGEIEVDRDIINRFKYDLFYLENWSLLLDLKIIYLTILNMFKGEEKAY
ncbi:MAG: exopolysaccharide biosynthesis polyprenyl glycosylphosphotransferase [Flavobacteriaceae bacterium]|jgi:putative colanic acid biosynthesis UDP-glucose lipid carrier transferase|nr:exopolysaccharide biosynthesis polyprenyl glycosylphosphotransferase [Flavobacteriaceae bacterium]